MKSRTIHLPILCVVPGMTLASALTDRAGRTLFAAATVLDAVMLDRLNKRGIESVAVHVVDTRDAETIDAEVRTAETRVRQIFCDSGGTALDVLQDAVLAFRREGAQ
jgi:hypothetical protein